MFRYQANHRSHLEIQILQVLDMATHLDCENQKQPGRMGMPNNSHQPLKLNHLVTDEHLPNKTPHRYNLLRENKPDIFLCLNSSSSNLDNLLRTKDIHSRLGVESRRTKSDHNSA